MSLAEKRVEVAGVAAGHDAFVGDHLTAKRKTPAGEEGSAGVPLFSNAGLGGGCPANVRAERGRRFAPTEFLRKSKCWRTRGRLSGYPTGGCRDRSARARSGASVH